MILKLVLILLTFLVTGAHATNGSQYDAQRFESETETLNSNNTKAVNQALQAYVSESAPTPSSDAKKIDNYEYGAFGEEDGQQVELAGTPFRYTGRWGGYSDADVGQVLNWNRWYGPGAGRWGSRDPIGDVDYENLYIYVGNTPIAFLDPIGLYEYAGENVLNAYEIPGDSLLDKFLVCMDNCAGTQIVTATKNGQHSDPGHSGGTSVDLRPNGSRSSATACCAGKCGAKFGIDERTLKTKHGEGHATVLGVTSAWA